MIRPVATEVILFLAPFALYAAFIWATKSRVLDVEHWPLSRVLTLGHHRHAAGDRQLHLFRQ